MPIPLYTYLFGISLFYIWYGIEYVIIRFFHNKQSFAYHDVSFEEEAHNNVKVYRCSIPCKEGINSLKYYHISPNLALERIVMYREGTSLPESYLGPKESFFICN